MNPPGPRPGFLFLLPRVFLEPHRPAGQAAPGRCSRPAVSSEKHRIPKNNTNICSQRISFQGPTSRLSRALPDHVVHEEGGDGHGRVPADASFSSGSRITLTQRMLMLRFRVGGWWMEGVYEKRHILPEG